MSTAATTPIKVTLGDGSVVEGATLEEAFKNVSDMKVNTANAWREEKMRAQNAEAEAQRLREENARLKAPAPAPVADGAFSKERYYSLLNDDPMAAHDYVFEHRFGQKPDDFAAGYQQVAQKVSAFEQQAVAAMFVQQHADDFPQTAEAAKALRLKTEELISQGHPYGLRTVELAYQETVRDGSIKPVEKQQEQVTERPNPSLSGSGSMSASDAEIQKFERMTTSEQEAWLRSKGMI